MDAVRLKARHRVRAQAYAVETIQVALAWR
jgi:hypothetical protein